MRHRFKSRRRSKSRPRRELPYPPDKNSGETLADFQAKKRLLPLNCIQIPRVKFGTDPLSLIALEHFDLTLRYLQERLRYKIDLREMRDTYLTYFKTPDGFSDTLWTYIGVSRSL